MMFTPTEARALTDRARLTLTDFIEMIQELYEGEAHLALGYDKWEEYMENEFSDLADLPRFSRVERVDLNRRLQAAGMSTREAGATLGVGNATVARDLSVSNDTGRSTERDRKLRRAETLAAQGMSFRKIGHKVGLDESAVRRDMAVREAQAQAQAGIRAPRIAPEPSVAHPELSIACSVESAPSLIREIDGLLLRVTGKLYTLSRRDRNSLSRVLAQAQQRLDHYDETN